MNFSPIDSVAVSRGERHLSARVLADGARLLWKERPCIWPLAMRNARRRRSASWPVWSCPAKCDSCTTMLPKTRPTCPRWRRSWPMKGASMCFVNNFGTSNPSKDLDIEHTDPHEFINTVSINLKSVFITSQAALRHMVEQGAAVSSIFRRLAVPFPTSRRLGMARRRRPSTI